MLNGEMVYLWRAVDQEGEILEIHLARTRDKGRCSRLHEEGAEGCCQPNLNPVQIGRSRNQTQRLRLR